MPPVARVECVHGFDSVMGIWTVKICQIGQKDVPSIVDSSLCWGSGYEEIRGTGDSKVFAFTLAGSDRLRTTVLQTTSTYASLSGPVPIRSR